MHYHVRNLQSSDFSDLMDLEAQVVGRDGQSELGPYYVRLCCDFFSPECFVVTYGDQIVGYLLSFIRDREAYCTTLAVTPPHQGGRAVHLMIRAYVGSIIGRIDRCWFTLRAGNDAARALHAALGAEEVGVRTDFYGPGTERIVACIDPERVVTLRNQYKRLGLIPGRHATMPSGGLGARH
jgi:ribosomal protein S18 acetylase RimI-like enzyme